MKFSEYLKPAICNYGSFLDGIVPWIGCSFQKMKSEDFKYETWASFDIIQTSDSNLDIIDTSFVSLSGKGFTETVPNVINNFWRKSISP